MREIQVAAKLGGGNPDLNARLAAAVANAKKQSVTKDTIERAIARLGHGSRCSFLDDTVIFEGFAKHQVPAMVECLTDNNNRTSSEVKVIFRDAERTSAARAAWRGCSTTRGMIEATHPAANQDHEMAALEAEADDAELIEAEGEDAAGTSARFYCQASNLDAVTKALKAAGWTVTTSELSYRAKSYPELSDAQREEVTNFLQELDAHDDVHRVHAALK